MRRTAKKSTEATRRLGLTQELHALLEANPEGVLVADIRSLRILEANKSASRMFGYSRKQFLAKRVLDIHPPDGKKKVLTHFREIVQGKEAIVSNIQCRKKNGTLFFADITAQPIAFRGRSCLLGFFRDVTERNRAERELQTTKERLEYVLGATKTGIDVIDADFNLNYVDPEWQKVYGNPAGRKCYAYFMGRKRKCLGCGIPKALRTGKVMVTEEVLPREGNRRIEVHTIPFKDPRGKWLVAEFNIDITDRKKAEELLKSSEARYRALFKSSQDAMMTLGPPTWKFTSCNAAMLRMFGAKSEKELLAHSPWMLSPQKQPDGRVSFIKAREMIRRAILKGSNFFEWTHRRLNGESFPAEVLLSKVERAGTMFLQATVRDISERKKAEQTVRENEARMRRFYESGLLGIIHWERSGAITEANDRFLKMVGYSRKDLEAGRINGFKMTPPEYRRLDRQAIAELKATGIHNRPYEKEYIRKDGSRVSIAIAGSVVDKARFSGIGFILDITERKRMEKEGRSAQLQYQQLVENAKDGIFTIDPKGRFLLTNPEFRAMMGCNKKELYQLNILDTYPDEMRASGTRRMKKLLHGGVLRFERPMKRKDGSLIFVDASVWKAQDGNIQAFVRDITERKKAENELRSSEERLRLQFKRMPVGCILWGADFRVLSWNPAAEKVFGYRASEAMGRKAFQLIVPRNVQPIVKLIWRRLLRGDATAHSVNENITKSGKKIVCKWTNTPIRDAGGCVIGVLSMVEDITEFRRAQDALKESEQRLRTVMSNSRDIVYRRNMRTDRYDFFSPSVKDVVGYSAKEMTRKTIHFVKSRVHPDDLKASKRLLEEVRFGKVTGGTVDYRFRHKRGGYRWLSDRFTIVSGEDGKPLYWVAVSRDVTETKLAEEKLRDKEKQLRQIIDTVPHWIVVKDKKGKILLANEAFARFYGTTPQSVVGKYHGSIHRVKKEIREVLRHDRETLVSEIPRIFRAQQMTDLRGETRMLYTVKMPFQAAGFKEPALLAVAVDVTEQKKVEEFRNSVIRTVSHELRTPLSIQKEGINLILDESSGPINAQQKMLLETVMRSTNRLSRMISSLLDISRIETGKVELKREPVVLGDLAEEVVFEFKRKASEKGLTLQIKSLEDRSVKVFADPDKIAQVLGNLLDNGIKFTEKGAIEVSINALKDEVECKVRDTGAGIEPVNIPRVFEKFQQFTRIAGPGEKGLGLGLPIAKGIIDMHGGRIWVKSQPGWGTQITFTLPIFDPAASSEDAKGSASGSEGGIFRSEKEGI